MTCCGFFCGSKQDHVLSHAFFQILESMQFWKINTWENIIRDDTTGLREKELKYTRNNVHTLTGSLLICNATAFALVSNCCGHFIVFHTSIVVRSGWDFLKQKLNPELCLRDT